MQSGILSIEDLGLSADFVFVEEIPQMIEVCSICSNCCYSDCTGGN